MQASVPGAFAHCQSFPGGGALGFFAVARPILEPVAWDVPAVPATPDCGAAGAGARKCSPHHYRQPSKSLR
jgi:hypothetical protein